MINSSRRVLNNIYSIVTRELLKDNHEKKNILEEVLPNQTQTKKN